MAVTLISPSLIQSASAITSSFVLANNFCVESSPQSQVNIAKELLDSYDLDIQVFGLFKNDKHQTEGIVKENNEKIILDRKSKLFLMLTSMQNEVHRFAITYFRKSHLKNYKKTILDDIEGLGNARKALIYDTYENINDLYKADLNELCQLLPKEVAKKLFEKLHKTL